ncbi:MAG: tRNA adenosine(34) deaminase TadA [Acidobacteriota bacterium]|nr:tRNA adenosine(34) deaminase TadA [Acidobacteriota bacterium]
MKTFVLSAEERFMREALIEACKARVKGEVPIGAVVVAEGRIVARGSNRPVSTRDPSAHAEIVALRKAGRKLGNYRLSGCDLYVTLEPCAMCLGAVVQARIDRLVYGAADPKSGAVHSIMNFPFDKLNHRPEITGGVLADACGAVLKSFFLERRRRPPKTRSETP